MALDVHPVLATVMFFLFEWRPISVSGKTESPKTKAALSSGYPLQLGAATTSIDGSSKKVVAGKKNLAAAVSDFQPPKPLKHSPASKSLASPSLGSLPKVQTISIPAEKMAVAKGPSSGKTTEVGDIDETQREKIEAAEEVSHSASSSTASSSSEPLRAVVKRRRKKVLGPATKSAFQSKQAANDLHSGPVGMNARLGQIVVKPGGKVRSCLYSIDPSSVVKFYFHLMFIPV